MSADPNRFDVLPIEAIEAPVEPYDWVFATEREAEIEAIWAAEIAKSPRLFNGEVLIQHRGTVDGGVFRAGYSLTRYKPFLAWMRLGTPPPYLRNGFAMAALRASDGAFLLGEMGPGTANAGKIYFAAGTPDPSDIVDGRVDLAGSVMRELAEETGLVASDVTTGAGWTAVMGLTRVAFMRDVTIDLPAEAARRLILERMQALPEQELADIHIVRSRADIDPVRMPAFQVAFLESAFG